MVLPSMMGRSIPLTVSVRKSIEDGCGLWPYQGRIHLALAHSQSKTNLDLYIPQRSFDMKNIRILFVVLVAFICTASSLASALTLTITVNNNSSREIRHLYLSPANNDNWGPDQLDRK